MPCADGPSRGKVRGDADAMESPERGSLPDEARGGGTGDSINVLLRRSCWQASHRDSSAPHSEGRCGALCFLLTA